MSHATQSQNWLARATLVVAATMAVGCSSSAVGTGAASRPAPERTRSSTLTAALPCCLEAGREVAERYRATGITRRRFTHDELWATLDPIVAAPSLRVAEIGRSIQGRSIKAATFGSGPTRVLLWSQMHGDESTATMSLADLLGWFADPAGAQREMRDQISRQLTVVMVPMLNPDGAELFQRQNAVGVDVNRDAASLATPEGRALKALRDSLRPQFGFNLHDQNARTLAGNGGKQAAIALLAPALNAQRTFEGARINARLVAAGMAAVLDREIPGRVARYDDSFNPRAFGDLMQTWGTSTVLVESGAMPGDPEKQRLRALNVVALVSALDAIATGRYASTSPAAYDALPMNARQAMDVIIVGASVVMPGHADPFRVDLSLNYDEPVARLHPRVREVGDLRGVVALDTISAAGLFLHPQPSMLTEQGGYYWLRIDAPAAFTLRRGADARSEVVRSFPAESRGRRER